MSNVYRFRMGINKTIIINVNSSVLSFNTSCRNDIGYLTWNNNLRAFRLEYQTERDKMDLLAFLETICGIQTKYDSYNVWITYEDYLDFLTFLKLKGE